MDKRLAGANFVRATACVMVLCHHVFQRISLDVLPRGMSNTVEVLTMGSFGVAAFFVLSGYLLARPFWVALDAGAPMPSLRTYWLRRAARIFPGFWLALVIAFVLSLTIFQAKLDGTLILRFVAGIFGLFGFYWLTWFPVEVDAPLWSIGEELISYAVLPALLWLVFVMPFARGWWARLVWLALIAATVGLQALAQIYLQPGSYHRDWQYGLVGGAKVWWPAYSPFAFFAMFAVGSLAAAVQVRIAEFRHWAFDIAFVGGVAVAGAGIAWMLPVAEGYGLAKIPYGYPIFPLGVAIMLAAAPSSRFISRWIDWRPITFVAQISFGLYIWHYVLLELVRQLWLPTFYYRGMTNIGAWATASVGAIACSVAIAILSYRFLEAPIIQWARQFERPPKRSSASNVTQAAE